MVAFRSASGAGHNGTGGSASWSVTKPAGAVANDFMAALVYQQSNVSTTALALSGGATWIVLDSGTTTSGGAWKLFWKSAGGAEPASYTATQSSAADVATCVIVCSNGGAAATPVFAKDTTQASTSTVDTPGFTPAGATDLEIRLVAARSNSLATTWTTPGSLTERADVFGDDGSFFTALSAAGTRTLASGAATGSLAFTPNQPIEADSGIGITLGVTDSFPQTVSPSGIATAEAFGTPQINMAIAPTGIASAEAFGTLVITTPEAQSIAPSGIASGEAFGTLTTLLFIGPSGIASDETFGAVRLGALIGPTGIASEEAFGVTNVAIQQFITPTGVDSAEAFGTASLQLGYPQSIFVDGIASGELVEDPTIRNTDRMVLVNPSIQETPLAWDQLNIRFGIHRGITIMQDADGVWRSVRYPSQTEMEAAMKVYMGGHRHVVSGMEAAELIAAGYSSYLHLEPDI